MSIRAVNPNRTLISIQKPSENFAFLNEEINRIIVETTDESHLNAVTTIRLVQLLTQMKVHFGPDPKNSCFRRYLRTSLKHLNHRIAIFLIKEKYVLADDLRDLSPDYLFLLFDYALDMKSTFSTEPTDFLKLVKFFETCSTINSYYDPYRKSTLHLIINCLDSEVCKNRTLLGDSAKLAFEYLTSLEHFSPNLCNIVISNSVLQAALDETKFAAAFVLIEKGIVVNCIIFDNILFTRKCRRTLQLLYESGVQFPPAKTLQQMWSLFEGDSCFEVFIKWLEKRQRGVQPLTCLAWRQLQTLLGIKAMSFYKDLSKQFQLPQEFDNYVHMRSILD